MARITIGDKAIEFKLIGVDDQYHSLQDYAGKRVVGIIFSCNHCPYVRAWEDRMVRIQAEYVGKGVQLIVINANDSVKYPDDGFHEMKKRAAEKHFNFPYLRDEAQEVARGYGAERTPEVFLFDNDRILRYHGVIDDNYDDPKAVKTRYLKDAIESVLADRPVAVSETKPIGCTIKWK